MPSAANESHTVPQQLLRLKRQVSSKHVPQSSRRTLVRPTSPTPLPAPSLSSTTVVTVSDTLNAPLNSSRLSKKVSSARTARTPSALLLVTDSSAGGDVGVGDNRIDQTTSLEDAADTSDHFFSIETRVELKERLAELQRQLPALLVQTKLAWMKCFADTSAPRACSDEAQDKDNGRTSPSRNDALLAASELVTEGERVTAALKRAFANAVSTSTCPIKQYQDLVERVEGDFVAFQQLVTRIAHTTSFKAVPEPSMLLSTTVEATAGGVTTTAKRSLKPSASEPTVGRIVLPFPVSYDLPSMKSYYARVAPPYSSYLPKKS